MESDWIKMKRGLRHDAKVIAVTRYLCENKAFMRWWADPVQLTCKQSVTEIVTFANVTRVTVASLLDVWSSLNLTLGKDGSAPFMRLSDIDDIAEIPCLGEAMESVGWVVQNEDGGLMFPNFASNNVISKARGKAKTPAERAKEYRARKKEKKEPSQSSRNVTQSRVEYNRVDIKKSVPKEKESEDQVELLYKKYPLKKAPIQAKKAIAKALKAATFIEINLGLDKYIAAQSKPDAPHTAYPATWFNGGRWADEMESDSHTKASKYGL